MNGENIEAGMDLNLSRNAGTYPMTAPKSVDFVRVIRRSLRCFAFGLAGAVPLVGLGLAYQATRLARKAFAEMNQYWAPPRMRWHWLGGLFCLWGYDYFSGLPGFFSVFAVLLWLQMNHVWRRFPPVQDTPWNPAARHLRWGLALAYAGYFGALSFAALLLERLAAADW